MYYPIIIKGEITNYAISKRGYVKNITTGKILKSRQTEFGHMQITIRLNNKSKFLFVHRLLAFLFIPNPDNLPWVNHLDNNPSNNKISNLQWCTPLGNTLHAIQQGRRHRKLTKAQVLEIRANYQTHQPTYKELGLKYNVSISTIHCIINNNRWKSLGTL